MHPAAPLIKLALQGAPTGGSPTAIGAAGLRAAGLALADLFPTWASCLSKVAAVLDELKSVKRDSDARNWKAKHGRLRDLINRYPSDFYIDSAGPRDIVGVTHRSSGFRYHMPRHALPEPWLQQQVAKHVQRTAKAN